VNFPQIETKTKTIGRAEGRCAIDLTFKMQTNKEKKNRERVEKEEGSIRVYHGV
jgi:hypothetical protein